MSTTPIYALPYPVPGDTVDVPRDIQALAARLEAVLTAGQTMPTGAVIASAASSTPSGYLLCDGGSYLRAGVDGIGGAYPTLFAALGGAASPFGLPDGTHFNVPDLRGRVPVGVDGIAARMAANDALGNAAGEEKHSLVLAEQADMPVSWSRPNDLTQTGRANGTGAAMFTFEPTGGALAATDLFAYGNGSTGTGHNNMPPYQIVNWLIKF